LLWSLKYRGCYCTKAGSKDCGIHAIANATAVAIGKDPSLLKYDQAVMRYHLIKWFNAKKIDLFPTVA